MATKNHLYKIKGDPIFWKLKAEELKYAAEIIWPHANERSDKIGASVEPGEKEIDITSLEPDTYAIFLSLLGFSIECLLKALIIKNDPTLLKNGHLPQNLKSHELIYLAELANIKLTNGEASYCTIAHRAMVVDSRYPIDLNVKPATTTFEIDGHIKDVLDSLYLRLTQTLDIRGEEK